ncbi:thiamine-phosphate kinase [Sulfurimonas sp.]|uniref:thiamine-phosphate kinase n=1 Tax=Sulfurimonas sp. TaxID=2022749 RepID=UPI002B47C4C5|nr:thiamine-phosphate kinase [Sulfurimonas sp.]
MKESYFIAQFDNKHIGDDGALIDNKVYSKDAFFQNVHFKAQWMNHYQIATKAMMINISDAIAMNAQPKYALLSVAMPKSITKEQMRELASGFKDVASLHDIEIIGGDTISNSKLDITITIVSEVEKPLLRVGMRNKHLLAFTGDLGRSKKDLKRLFNLGILHKNSKFLNIKLRGKFINASQRFLSSGMDISDGLFSDLGKLSQINKLGYIFNSKLSNEIACSGEEYEMLISFDMRHKKTLIRRAQQTRTPLNIFAQASRVKYSVKCKEHHF